MDTQQQAYVDNMKSKLHAFNSEIEELKSKAYESSAKTRSRLADELDELSRKRSELASKLDKLAGESGEAWEQMRDKLRNAADEIKEGIARGKAELES